MNRRFGVSAAGAVLLSMFPRFRRREVETVVEEGPPGPVVEEEVLESPPPRPPLVWPWLLTRDDGKKGVPAAVVVPARLS